MRSEDIAAGARTVAHLANYFQELRLAAEELIARSQVSRRGYFAPTEEEAVRRLQISYWQSRAALFDVILSIRDESDRVDELYDAAFLVGYAAAALLVDAARFLRESFEPLPAVRRKLNEPEPSFGISKGTYDAVQKSLTSPRHAWHLYHAMCYFDEHEAELRATAADPLLAPMLAVIDRLGDRVRVPAARYLKARARVRARRAISRIRHGLLGRAMYGIQKLAGTMAEGVFTRRGHRPHLPDHVAAALRDVLQPGDVLITRKEFAVTNYFLPGYWKHAALYFGEHRVLEALKDGVWLRGTDSPFRADAIVVLRPRLGEEDITAALARGKLHEGKMYDFDFDFTRADRLVCTEVIYRSYDGIGGTMFELTPRAGRLTLAAIDLVGMALRRACFEPLVVFAPKHESRLVDGADADSLLSEICG